MTEANIFNDSAKVPAEVVQINDPVVQVPAVVKPAKRSYSRIYGRNEVLDGEYKLYQKLLAEFIGTALFVFGVISTCVFFAGIPVIVVLACSFMGGVIIYLFGRVSGAHFNPAISLALFIRGKLTAMELGLYIVAQVLGSFLGCVFLGLIRRGKFKEMAGNAIAAYLIDIGGKKNAWCYISALINEIINTFILIMFILASCERDNYLGPTLGLAFASTLISLNAIGGNCSSCSLNPARSIGPAFVQLFAGGNKDPIKQIWIYLVGPFLGGIIAAVVWPLFFYGE